VFFHFIFLHRCGDDTGRLFMSSAQGHKQKEMQNTWPPMPLHKRERARAPPHNINHPHSGHRKS